MVYQQDKTHNEVEDYLFPVADNGMCSDENITSVSHSARYTESNHGYWYPEEFIGWLATQLDSAPTKEDLEFHWAGSVETSSPTELRSFMKNELGVKRKEVYNRGADMLQNREFTLGGYWQPNGWQHFINQRMRDLHTQQETRELTELINKEIYNA
jgi:hypothetical protein